jgi:hypothetical protein
MTLTCMCSRMQHLYRAHTTLASRRHNTARGSWNKRLEHLPAEQSTERGWTVDGADGHEKAVKANTSTRQDDVLLSRVARDLRGSHVGCDVWSECFEVSAGSIFGIEH